MLIAKPAMTAVAAADMRFARPSWRDAWMAVADMADAKALAKARDG
ncbi:hypothetical protein ACFPOU_07705 [Massilia jejuensis]|uniref:Uncharacterized protein n=1 Tax=Massilia jejuensis TaxID=648894 RepID=A0ABW0PFB3_9BURK